MKETLIFDRTADDVANARSIVQEKIKEFIPLTEEEAKTVEKGTASLSTINRIEEAQGELYVLIKELAYYGSEPNTKEWVLGEIFNEEDLSRLIENGEILRDSFLVYSDTPSKSEAKYDYNNLNKIEKLLYDLFSIVEYIEENSKECDTFYSGEE